MYIAVITVFLLKDGIDDSIQIPEHQLRNLQKHTPWGKVVPTLPV